MKCKYFCSDRLYIYICVKKFVIFYVEFTKQKFIFSFFTPQFFIQKIHMRPACKTYRDEQERAGRKFEVLSGHTF